MAETFSIDIPLQAPSEEIALRARLTVAEQAASRPAIFLLPGGGLSDGDGNDADIGFAPLAQLATALGDAGYSSLRFDRRGTGATGGEYVGPDAALEDFAAVLETAKTLPELPRPWVMLGLGEAAAWASILAAQQSDMVDGLVLISPPTGAIGDMFRFRQQTDELLASTPAHQHRELLQQQVAAYEAQTPIFAFKPILETRCPTLVLHGDMDWLCPVFASRQLVSEVTKRNQGPQDLTYKELPGLDSWLIATDRWRSPAEQLQPHWSLDRNAVEILVDWLSRKFCP